MYRFILLPQNVAYFVSFSFSTEYSKIHAVFFIFLWILIILLIFNILLSS